MGPGIAVPIKPLTVVKEDGRFAPIFFNPWSEIAFDDYQASLYMTVLEQSIFRLTDFEDSPGRVVFLPKMQVSKGVWERKPVIWKRGQHRLLSQSELNNQIEIFAESRGVARRWYEEYLERNNH